MTRGSGRKQSTLLKGIRTWELLLCLEQQLQRLWFETTGARSVGTVTKDRSWLGKCWGCLRLLTVTQ